MSKKKNEESLIKQYLDYHVKFQKEYGEKTAVLMQVGAFFEMYGIDNDKEKTTSGFKFSMSNSDKLNLSLKIRNFSTI